MDHSHENSHDNDEILRVVTLVQPLKAASREPEDIPASMDENSVVRGEDCTPAVRENIPVSLPTNRRSSSRTDATPRFQNTTDESYDESLLHSEATLEIPLEVKSREHTFGPSNHANDISLSSFISNTSSLTGTNVLGGDTSLESRTHSLTSAPPTPTSNAPASFGHRTPERKRYTLHRIGMDGSVEQVSLRSTSAITTLRQSPTRSQQQISTEEEGNSDQRNTPLRGSIYSIGSLAEQARESESFYMTRSKETDVTTVDDDEEIGPATCCGINCPNWISRLLRATPSLHVTAICVVNALPCFWFCGKTTQGNATDRAVLTRLNIVCIFMTYFHLMAALWLATLLLIVDGEAGALNGFAPNYWNLNGALFAVGILAFILMVTSCCTIRVIREVDLVGTIRYLWVLLWIIPFEIFFTVSLYDYHQVTDVWISHWWLTSQMAWFRGYFCEDGTEESKCLVPIMGGPDFKSEEAWCMANFNAINCEQIRDDAQWEMRGVMLTVYSVMGVWGTALLFIMLLMKNSLERIISKPIVRKSRETNVPLWLSLPIITNSLVGSILLFSPSSLLSSSSGADGSWIGVAYLVAAALFFVALLTGWFLSSYTIQNYADKQTKTVAVVILIVVMAANLLMLATIFVASILFSSQLIDSDNIQRGVVACEIDQGASCTLCDDGTNINDRCPEWTDDEVTRILRSQLKQSATLAAIFTIYATSVFRFGVGLRRHLGLYQIDYV